MEDNGQIQEFEGEETLSTVPYTMDSTDNVKEVYPDAVLNISRETASVFQMKRKCAKQRSMLDLSPPFQRDLVWNSKQKCELIESIIMGIPLPAFYVKENKEGVYIVVDGKQRLQTLFEFINGEFKLDRLTILKNHNSLSFTQLTPVEQNKIEDYSLNINVIKAPTSDRVTFDLFDRVNRGGTKLNNQEMRNALYQGTSTKLIDGLAGYDCFKQAVGDISPKHMKDRYLVLRFLAFYLWYSHESMDIDTMLPLEYKSNIEDFLGKTMSFLNTKSMDDSLISYLIDVFNRTMTSAASYVVPLGGFRLPSLPGQNKRPVNMAFFESFCCLIAVLDNPNGEVIGHAYHTLMNNDDYRKSLTYSIDSRNQIRIRYECIKQYISENHA